MRDPHYPAGEDGRRFLKVESPEARFFVELVNTDQTPVQPRAILHGTAAQCLYPELPPSLARLISPATVRRAFFLADLERPGQQRPRLAIGGTRSRFIRERRLNEHQKQRPEYISLSIVNGNPTDLFKASISKHSTSYGSSPPQQAVGSRLGDPRRTVPKGEKIFKEGEKADFFYRVASGVVRTCTALNDGRRIINDFHFADDILGLDPGAQHH